MTPERWLPALLILTFGLALSPNVSVAQSFYLDSNGITIKCENASPGDTWMSFGVEYLAVDNQTIRSELADGRDLSTVCTSHVTELQETFFFSPGFNDDIRSWDVSNVVRFHRTFSQATTFNRDIGMWDVSSATTMDRMFESASSFNGDISNWDVTNVTNMHGMFRFASSFNQNISNWDMSGVLEMSEMFLEARSFNQDISGWDVSQVENFASIFSNAYVFNQDIGQWDVSSARNMRGMFAGALEFDQNISGWQVSNVTDMNGMFFQTRAFNQDIGDWDTSSVTNMGSMFIQSAFNRDIGGWDVKRVANMSSMFEDAVAFNQDLSKWCVPQIASAPSKFADRSPLEGNNAFYPNWGCQVSPEADARASVQSGIAPLNVTFTAAFSTDLNGDDLSYLWDFSEGTTSTETVVNKTFSAGEYAVTLVVSDGQLTDTSIVSIQSLNLPPEVSLSTSEVEGLAPLAVSFDASGSTDQNGDTLIFGWDFGDGDTSNEPSTEHTFKAGQYDVLLVVSDGIDPDTSFVSINSINEPPSITLLASAISGQAPFEITFDGSGTTDANSDDLTFAWRISDGWTYSDTTVAHLFTAAGDYKVVLNVSDGIASVSDSVTVSIASGVAIETSELPGSYELRPAYPNPFNPTTTLTYALPQASDVRITVTDLLGRQVATLVFGGLKPAGYHTVQFDAGRLSSGTYLVTMEAEDFTKTIQVVLLK